MALIAATWSLGQIRAEMHANPLIPRGEPHTAWFPDLVSGWSNAPALAVFLNRLGGIRDWSFENQRYRVVEYGLPGKGGSCATGLWEDH